MNSQWANEFLKILLMQFLYLKSANFFVRRWLNIPCHGWNVAAVNVSELGEGGHYDSEFDSGRFSLISNEFFTTINIILMPY